MAAPPVSESDAEFTDRVIAEARRRRAGGGDDASAVDELRAEVSRVLNDPVVMASLSVEQLKKIIALLDAAAERKRRGEAP
jgi:hypothetical protein